MANGKRAHLAVLALHERLDAAIEAGDISEIRTITEEAFAARVGNMDRYTRTNSRAVKQQCIELRDTITALTERLRPFFPKIGPISF